MGEKPKEINSWDEVPKFESEDEEDEFWSGHVLGPGLLDRMRPAPEGPPALEISPSLRELGITSETARRIQRIARIKGERTENLIREFVTDRLHEEERRAGIR